jgi:DNA (cytosine-5)-methyltransferase 1
MEQITLFSGSSEIRIDKKIRLIELFAGIGSQAKALKNIGADFEHYRICEFDKYAVTSYNAIHGTDFKVSDITKWHAADLGIIEKDKYEYIVTYSFPCQSLSVAGKGEGMAKGSGTRSGLLWEVERLLEECGNNLPQILLMENVDAILFEKNRKHFFQWCNRLEEFGYKNYYEVLNAKDYGIPQNRNRCFMVSILGNYYFEFPKPIKLELCVKDMLEKEVPEKYYLSKQTIDFFISNTIKHKEKGNGFTFNPTNGDGVAKTITSKAGSRMDDNFITIAQTIMTSTEQAVVIKDEVNVVGNYMKSGHDASRIINPDGIAPAVKENHGTVTAVVERKPEFGRMGKQTTEKEIIPCEIRHDKGIVTYKGNVMGALRTISECGDKHIIEYQKEDLVCYNQFKDNGVQTSLNDRIYDSNNSGLAVTTSPFFMPNYLVREKPEYKYRIRKLMPIECYRLMGFTREDFFKVKKAGISDSQCYKQAGNSIVVNVLEAIFRNMNMKGVKRWQK